MNIPVVLTVVTIDIDIDGTLTVTVGGQPHGEDRPLHRGDLSRVVDAVATRLGEPVRVEVREADGTAYTDIVVPPEHTGPDTDAEPEAAAPASMVAGGVVGHGFVPGESVAVAYVLAEQTADAHGSATLGLPAGALAGRAANLMLVGLGSGTATRVAVSS